MLDGSWACDWSQAAAIGDDWPDLPVLTRAAPSPAAPANAHAEVRAVAHHVTQRARRRGAAREFCDLLLVAGGRYAAAARRPYAVSRWPLSRGAHGPCALVARAPGTERLTIYLPIILMGLMALGTYWLVRNTPTLLRGPAPRGRRRTSRTTSCAASRSRRFEPDGRAARASCRARKARHYPDTDTLEIDQPRMRSVQRRGDLTRGDAPTAACQQRRRHRGAADRRRGRHARSRHGPNGTSVPRLEFRGEFLHAFLDTERVQSHKPVDADPRRRPVHRRQHGLRQRRPASRTCRAACAACCMPSAARPAAGADGYGAAGLHHRRIQRHRPGAGVALLPGRLAAGAGGAPRRMRSKLGAGAAASAHERYRSLWRRRRRTRQHRRRRAGTASRARACPTW